MDMVAIVVLIIVMTQDNTSRANLAKVKEHLSEYVARVEQGESIVICRHNRPVVRMVASDENTAVRNRTRLGSAKGSVKVKCDLTAPALPESDWETMK